MVSMVSTRFSNQVLVLAIELNARLVAVFCIWGRSQRIATMEHGRIHSCHSDCCWGCDHNYFVVFDTHTHTQLGCQCFFRWLAKTHTETSPAESCLVRVIIFFSIFFEIILTKSGIDRLNPCCNPGYQVRLLKQVSASRRSSLSTPPSAFTCRVCSSVSPLVSCGETSGDFLQFGREVYSDFNM